MTKTTKQISLSFMKNSRYDRRIGVSNVLIPVSGTTRAVGLAVFCILAFFASVPTSASSYSTAGFESNSTAQQNERTITGTVTDFDEGIPLVGVSVSVKGNPRIGTITNSKGEFTLKVKNTDKAIVLSYVGYLPKEQNLSGLVKYDVVLSKNVNQLNEVVIAFGTSKKEELTNAVSTISAKDIEQRPISNLASAISGAAPGVQSTAGGGQPGDGPSIRIRGIGSVTGDDEPLYIVDGAPFEGVISNINPDDIESISILKDASSTALYGARAANGVILVTTKRGSNVKGADVITVRLSTAVSNRALPQYDILNAYEFFPVIWEIVKNSNGGNTDAGRQYATDNVVRWIGWNPFNVPDNQVVYNDGTFNSKAKLLYPDDVGFTDDMYRLGLRTDASVTYSAGTAKSDQYLSLNYLNEQGYIIGSDFKRLSARLRINATPTNWLKIGFNVTGNFSDNDRANLTSGSTLNPFFADLLLAPIYPVYKHDPLTGAYLLDDNGNRIYDPGDYKPILTGRNVVYESTQNVNNQRRNSLTGVNTIDAKITKSLKFTSNFSASLNNFRGEVYDNSIVGDFVGVGRTVRTNSTQYYLNWSKILNWSKYFDKHRVGLLVGHENYYNNWDEISGNGTGEAVLGLPILDNMVISRANSYERLYTTEGYLTKFDYNYDRKYIFSASFRRDGSSRFSEKNKRGNFWSVSAAYNVAREKFFKVNWIDDLKFRGSYGIVGNDRTGNYFTSKRLFSLGYDYGYDGGAMLTQVGNPNLKWEENKNADVAVEASFLKGRASVGIELFRRQSTNLLFDVLLPLTTGLTTVDDNFGSMRNQGIEITIGATPVKTKNFFWEVNLNATKYSNKIMSLPANYQDLVSGVYRYSVGKSRYEFWLKDWVGVDPANGNYLYAPDGKGLTEVTIDGKTYSYSGVNALYTYFGNPIPDWYGSLTNNLSYKRLSLRLMLNYQIGGQVYDEDYQRLTNLGTPGRALHKDMANHWTNPGDITDVGRLRTGTSSFYSDRMIMDGSYLNLRTVALTYVFSERLARRVGVKNAKAYINGENLFILSARKGMDPTRSWSGVASFHYAPSRIISLGLNLTL